MNIVSVFEVLLVSLSRSLKTINNMKNSGFTFRKRLASFRYAFNGIRLLIQKSTMRGYIVLRLFVWLLPAFLRFIPDRMDSSHNRNRSCIIGRSNQFIHRIIGRFSLTRIQRSNKKTKDLAAGAVLIMAIAAAIVGSIIFFLNWDFEWLFKRIILYFIVLQFSLFIFVPLLIKH